jgi:hypothetical protein
VIPVYELRIRAGAVDLAGELAVEPFDTFTVVPALASVYAACL